MNLRNHWESLRQDALYGLRQLRRNAGFTAVAAITLALGIGVNTAIFTVADNALLRPLPYPDSGRLMWITQRFALSFTRGGVLGPDFVAWRDRNRAFQQIEGFLGSQGPAVSLSGIGDPVAVRQTSVTTGFFSELGVQPIAGRSFSAADGRLGHEGVLLLGENLWRSQFGANPGVVGQTVRINHDAFTVIGVMPSRVGFPEADVWTPLVLNSSLFQPRSRPLAMVGVIGRLQPGATQSQAAADLSQITQSLDPEYPPMIVATRDRRVEIQPLHQLLVGNARSLLLILLGVSGLVFLIACANIANLLFSRASVRSREFAIRCALGAGRTRMLRQLLTEHLLLAVTGSALGFLCGAWSLPLLQRLVPEGLPTGVVLDARVFAFTAGATLLATVIFGFAPALASSRTEPVETLKTGGVRSGTGAGTQRIRSALAVTEIALSLVLLIGAGLLIRSFVRLSGVPLGFNPDHVLAAQVSRPMTNGFETPSAAPFFHALLQTLRATQGVREAGAASRMPLSTCQGFNGPIRPRGAAADLPSICTTTVTPGYFGAMQIPLLAGRDFEDRDSPEGPPVVMLNQTLARRIFGTRDPIGGQIGMYGLNGLAWRTVVGVVADARNSTLEQAPWPEVFVPYTQAPPLSLTATLVLRTTGDPESLAAAVRKAVQAQDPSQSVSSLQTLDDALSGSVEPQRFRTLLLGLFAALALALAAVGVFGVMAYSVNQRAREWGARIALGARPADILALVLREGMRLTGAGLGIGLIAALALTRFLSGFVYGVQTTDLATFAAAMLLLAAIALAACAIPARRAARLDPIVVLHNE